MSAHRLLRRSAQSVGAASQREAAARLPDLLLLSCRPLQRGEKEERGGGLLERRKEEEGERISQKAVRASWSLQSHHLLSAPPPPLPLLPPPQLLVLPTARDNQWCAQADCFLSCFKIVLSCLSSAGGDEGGDPFTDPLLFHLSCVLTRRSAPPIDLRPRWLVTQIELNVRWK